MANASKQMSRAMLEVIDGFLSVTLFDDSKREIKVAAEKCRVNYCTPYEAHHIAKELKKRGLPVKTAFEINHDTLSSMIVYPESYGPYRSVSQLVEEITQKAKEQYVEKRNLATDDKFHKYATFKGVSQAELSLIEQQAKIDYPIHAEHEKNKSSYKVVVLEENSQKFRNDLLKTRYELDKFPSERKSLEYEYDIKNSAIKHIMVHKDFYLASADKDDNLILEYDGKKDIMKIYKGGNELQAISSDKDTMEQMIKDFSKPVLMEKEQFRSSAALDIYNKKAKHYIAAEIEDKLKKYHEVNQLIAEKASVISQTYDIDENERGQFDIFKDSQTFGNFMKHIIEEVEEERGEDLQLESKLLNDKNELDIIFSKLSSINNSIEVAYSREKILDLTRDKKTFEAEIQKEQLEKEKLTDFMLALSRQMPQHAQQQKDTEQELDFDPYDDF